MCSPLLSSTLAFIISGMPLYLFPAPISTALTSSVGSQQELLNFPDRRASNIEDVVRDIPPYQVTRSLSPEEHIEFVSIKHLLEFPQLFHKKMVTVRGTIAQPEMHLDDTELFFDFVFLLMEGENSLVVFGQHDRTQGGSPIAMGNTVQVTGIFWKDRIAHDYHFKNNLEALTVTPYPSLTPNRT